MLVHTFADIMMMKFFGNNLVGRLA